jgi:hypothetical protein
VREQREPEKSEAKTKVSAKQRRGNTFKTFISRPKDVIQRDEENEREKEKLKVDTIPVKPIPALLPLRHEPNEALTRMMRNLNNERYLRIVRCGNEKGQRLAIDNWYQSERTRV